MCYLTYSAEYLNFRISELLTLLTPRWSFTHIETSLAGIPQLTEGTELDVP